MHQDHAKDTSRPRRPKKIIGPRLRSTDKSPKNSLSNSKNFFFQVGSSKWVAHVKSCSTQKKGNKSCMKKSYKIRHVKVHKKSSHEKIMIMQARRILLEEIMYEETMQDHVHEKHEDQISRLVY